MAATVPNTFVAGTTAHASEVNANFTALANKFNNAIDINDISTTLENTWLKLGTPASRSIRWGTSNTGSFANGQITSGSVSHGLGATPVAVLLCCGSIAVFSSPNGQTQSAVAMSWANPSSSTFGWVANIVDGFSNNGSNFFWAAIA